MHRGGSGICFTDEQLLCEDCTRVRMSSAFQTLMKISVICLRWSQDAPNCCCAQKPPWDIKIVFCAYWGVVPTSPDDLPDNPVTERCRQSTDTGRPSSGCCQPVCSHFCTILGHVCDADLKYGFSDRNRIQRGTCCSSPCVLFPPVFAYDILFFCTVMSKHSAVHLKLV